MSDFKANDFSCMRKTYLIYFIAALLAVVSCSKEITVDAASSGSGDTSADSLLDPCLVPGEIIVEFTEEFTRQVEEEFAAGGFLNTKAGGAGDVFASIGAVSVEPLYEHGGQWEPRHREFGLHRWYRIKYNEELPATKAGNALDAIPGVVYVEPVRKTKATAVFNDPYFSRQWHYYNDGSKSGMSAGSDINVVPVWQNYTAGSSNVIVSVVDGGIQLDHPDLEASTLPGGPDGSKNFCTNYIGYTIYPYDHGTHVAGTIGATNNNGRGVCGVAGGLDGNGGVKLMSCQIFMTNPKNPSGDDIGGDTYNAMIWGADHGAVISQNSWGYLYDNASQAAAGSVGSMKTAIDYFIKYAGCDNKGNQLPDSPMKGGVVIFAAGNDAWPDGWPAKYDACIAVGSFAAKYNRAYYSNYGDWVDICAPGGDYYTGYQVYSTTINGSYTNMQGTSMACPHVSGVAALLVSYFGGQGFTNEMLKEKLLKGAKYNTALNTQNIGPKLDALGSFLYGSGAVAPEPVTDLEVSAKANILTYSWSLTADLDDPSGKTSSYVLYTSKKKADLASVAYGGDVPASVVSKSYQVPADAALGDMLEASVGDLDFETTYYATVAALDATGLYSELSPVVTVRTLKNNPPVIEPLQQQEPVLPAFETRKLQFDIYDPDGHEFVVEYTPGGAADSYSGEGGRHIVTIDASLADPGTYYGMLVVTEKAADINNALRTVYTLKYQILPNRAPVTLKSLDGFIFEDQLESRFFDIAEYIQDPDGETLVYSVSHSAPDVSDVTVSGTMVTVTSLRYGIDRAVITATDRKGASCTLPLNVAVRRKDAGADVYPSQVADYLNIGGGAQQEADVRILSASGAVVYNAQVKISVFEPAKIDMRGFAPGVYLVKVTAGGQLTERTVVKI